MQEEKKYLKIEVPVENEAPFVPEQPAAPRVKERAEAVGRQVAETAVSTAKKAWESDTRKKVTHQVKRGATAVAGKTAGVVQDKIVKTAEEQAKAQFAAMQTRMQETDWKHEAKSGAARGLQWLSQKLAELAERFIPQNTEPPQDSDKT